MTFSKSEEKAINALRKAEQGAFSRVRAYVILPQTFMGHYGKIKVSYPADGMGKVHVWFWDCQGNNLQYGNASGCGYDKLSAALQGLKFDDIVFTDHPVNWEMQLRNAGYTVIQAV
jgi:hypothetical protein